MAKPVTITREDLRRDPYVLDRIAEFDGPFRVEAGGVVTDGVPGVYAPEVMDTEVSGKGWTLVNGYSGQHGYRGPGMHPSEFLGGRMALDVLATPGVYVITEDRDSADEDGTEPPSGWVLARLDGSGDGTGPLA